LETGTGASSPRALDGTTLALGGKGDLVLDELVYDPTTHAGKEVLHWCRGG